MKVGMAIRHIDKLYWLGVLVLVGLILLVLWVTRFAAPYTFLGAAINPPQPAPEFSVQDIRGQNFSLSDQKGKVVLLFFGYTSCPDECPATMAVLKLVKAGLGRNADRVDIIFISIDPARDTPPVVQAYVEKFDPSIIGITGTESELQPIWQNYGVYIEKTMGSTDTQYTLTHSTRIFLVDTQGNLHLTYSFGISPNDILQDIQHLLG